MAGAEGGARVSVEGRQLEGQREGTEPAAQPSGGTAPGREAGPEGRAPPANGRAPGMFWLQGAFPRLPAVARGAG